MLKYGTNRARTDAAKPPGMSGFLQEIQTIKGSFRQLQIAACYERRLWEPRRSVATEPVRGDVHTGSRLKRQGQPAQA